MQSEGVILFLYSEPCYVAEWFILRTSDRKSQDNWHGIANCQYPLALTISFLAGQTIDIQNLSRIVSSVAVSIL
jgi:hypothetical protein